MKKNLTDEQKKALGHVEYEHNMLKFTKEALVKCFSPKDSEWTCNACAFGTASGTGTPMNLIRYPKQEASRNALDAVLGNLNDALLESFLTHYRNLLYFYRKQKRTQKRKKNGKESDNIVAGDFCVWDISSAIPNIPNLNSPDMMKRKISKHLSHLTRERVGNTKQKWDIKQMAGEIGEGKTIFSEKLRNEFNTVPDFWTSH